jgi:transposase
MTSHIIPDWPDNYIIDENDIWVIDAFVNTLVLSDLDFKTILADTGRTGYRSVTLVKLFVYGYLNRIQSSNQLEREAARYV